MILFFKSFLMNNIILSFIILFIFLVKNIFKNYISDEWKYNFYFLIIILLFIPFLPVNILDFFKIINEINLFFKKEVGNFNGMNQNNNNISDSNWINDFAISVNGSISTEFINLFSYLWIFGAILLFLFVVFSIYKIHFILKKCSLCKDRKILKIFDECMKVTGLERNIKVMESETIYNPFTFQLRKTFIVIPYHILDDLSETDLKYIFLHELCHCKNKDMIINYILSIFQCIYWFHPFVWIIFKKMRNEREIICDLSVLKMLEKKEYISYGNTIINFIDKFSKKEPVFIISNMSGTKKEIVKRIKKIALFSNSNQNKKMQKKSIFIFIVTSMFVLMQSGFIFASHTNKFLNTMYEFKNSNVSYVNLESYFYEKNGCFVLYDLQSDEYEIYNKEKSLTRVSPNSTYKIYSALFGLESNAIKVNDTELEWNSVEQPFELWNKDQNLKSAMQNSVNWYFNEIDSMVGMKNLKQYFKMIEYGNYDVSGGISNYWLELSSLKISAVEQVQLLKKLYKNEFNFDNNNIEAVKNSILISSDENATLYGKTGTGSINNHNVNGWFIGFVEKNDTTYFFALNLSDGEDAKGSTAAEITISILKDKGIL